MQKIEKILDPLYETVANKYDTIIISRYRIKKLNYFNDYDVRVNINDLIKDICSRFKIQQIYFDFYIYIYIYI